MYIIWLRCLRKKLLLPNLSGISVTGGLCALWRSEVPVKMHQIWKNKVTRAYFKERIPQTCTPNKRFRRLLRPKHRTNQSIVELNCSLLFIYTVTVAGVNRRCREARSRARRLHCVLRLALETSRRYNKRRRLR